MPKQRANQLRHKSPPYRTQKLLIAFEPEQIARIKQIAGQKGYKTTAPYVRERILQMIEEEEQAAAKTSSKQTS